jgi:hypothetical protein
VIAAIRTPRFVSWATTRGDSGRPADGISALPGSRENIV